MLFKDDILPTMGIEFYMRSSSDISSLPPTPAMTPALKAAVVKSKWKISAFAKGSNNWILHVFLLSILLSILVRPK